ncbi:Laccase-2 [Psilocybe cubensis]|uniref:Laccase n=2 Tax=Psilocybe cubensis TaxID=181762 RepID=A0A8H7XUT8_PSICU|nr:Laccase-2 [Psilocybe cubensis]KAH9479120.1 Laccase-2 [Psilocybe cubensis]
MIAISSALSFFAFSATGAFAAIGPSTDLYIANKGISPNGYNRSAVLAGASPSTLQFPGPLITANKGDTFAINVIDQLTDTSMLTSTSIHWHGFFQKGTTWADGPVGVNQCPIAPGHSFMYQFSAADQAGTYWYHSHHETQYCDGLRGPMVVYDPDDPHKSKYDVDDESTVITLSDWYEKPAPSAGNFPTPNATLVNGLGRAFNGPASPLTVINVAEDIRYRFRLVSMSCDPNYNFSIDGHTMTIIEVDGVSVQPLEVDSIQIFAGQRYSFVLHADQAVDNYIIRAVPNLGHAGFEGGTNTAILRYVGASDQDPDFAVPAPHSFAPMLETNLHPLDTGAGTGAPGVHARGAADVNMQLDITFVGGAQSKFTISNGTAVGTFVPPPLPVLLQILSKKYTPQELLPAGNVFELPPNKVVEITMPGGSGGSPHPIHLHGHNFYVIRSAGSSVDNYDNPVIRDVVSLGSSKDDRVTIRFVTDNSGPWIMHCHIDWHLQLGLAVVFAENIPEIETFNPPPAYDELCPIYNALPPQTFN